MESAMTSYDQLLTATGKAMHAGNVFFGMIGASVFSVWFMAALRAGDIDQAPIHYSQVPGENAVSQLQ
jgi:hypothetical protein